MTPETKICQNCKHKFILNDDDFIFFEKFKVPSPNYCPDCRLLNKMVFRNQNKLYHRTNNAPEGGKIISIYSDEKHLNVYSRNYWWGDGWDALDYGIDVDLSKPFFEQVKNLIKSIPWPSLMNWNPVNSDYCNCTADNKNCYLVFGGDYNEDCSYSTFNMYSRESQDLYFVNKCELCLECIDCQNCYKLLFGQNCHNCADSFFLYDCINCQSCIGCTGLRNKQYCIFNQQYTRDQYLIEKEKLMLNTRGGLNNIEQKFKKIKLAHPHRFAQILKSENCVGDNITNARNCFQVFDADSGVEDLRYAYLVAGPLKDGYSFSHAGHGAEMLYDSFGIFSNANNVKFSIYSPSCQEVEYSYNCPSSSYLFGCVGMKKGKYSILNKQYEKEEYFEMVEKIKKNMDEIPYVDSVGRIWKYGDFFPSDLSPFDYNETIAIELFPCDEETAVAQGYTWRKKENRNYNPTILRDNIPDSFSGLSDNILNEIIECNHSGIDCGHDCTTAFKLTQAELTFYKKIDVPIPSKCPNCRHFERISRRNPPKVWSRSCMCDKDNHEHEGKCEVVFETSYSPDRPEIVYCEKCYQNEVI